MSNLDNSNNKVSCVICHLPINLTQFGRQQVTKNFVGCPNSHLCHYECLKKWIPHSSNCPVCHEKYDTKVINVFSEHLGQLEKDRKEAEEREREFQAKKEKLKQASQEEDPEYLEKFERVEKLIAQVKYTEALNLVWDINDIYKFTNRDPRYSKILFFLSYIYFKMKKHAQSIQQLMKLVKIDFNYPLAFYYLGLNYEEMGLLDKVKWAYDRSLLQIEKLSETQDYYKPFLEDLQQRIKNLAI
ncbi:MAG: hypothetical protein ACTSPA_15390 [Promethearchaeota archaeon]